MGDNGMNRMESTQTAAAMADRPRSGLRRPLAALLLAVAMALSIGAAAWVGIASLSPLDRVLIAAGRSVAAYERNGAARLLKRVSEGGSTELRWNLKTLTKSLLGVGLDLKASAKAYYDLSVDTDPRGAFAIDVALAGSSLFDLLLTGTRDDVTLSSALLLGEEACGVSLVNFMDNFDSSAFGPDGAYSMGVSAAQLRETLGSLEDSEAMTEAMVPAVAQALAALKASLEEHARISEGELAQIFRDGEVTVGCVGVYLDGAGLAAVAWDMAEFLRENQAVKNFMYMYADAMPYGHLGESGGSAAVDEFFAELDALTEEDFRIDADELLARVDEAALLFFIHPDNGQLVGLESWARHRDEAVMPLWLKVVAGPDLSRPDTFDLWAAVEGETAELHAQVEADDEARFAARFAVTGPEETAVEASFDWDRSGETCTGWITDGRDHIRAEGTLVADGEGAALTLDTVRVENSYGDVEEHGPLGLSLILRGQDDMPPTPSYTDVLTMSADQLEELAARLESALSGLDELLSAVGF